MADDTNNRSGLDRSLVAGEQDYEVRYFAEKHGISIGTARAQLKSVMAKSETHRQSELVSLMMRLSGPMNFVENGIGRLQRTNSSLR